MVKKYNNIYEIKYENLLTHIIYIIKERERETHKYFKPNISKRPKMFTLYMVIIIIIVVADVVVVFKNSTNNFLLSLSSLLSLTSENYSFSIIFFS